MKIPAHLITKNLSHVKLVFLPPNSTSVSRLMDQGVIRCPKAHYRKLLVKLILHSLNSNEPLLKVSLLTALILLLSAWNNVSQTKFVKCFKKANISEKDQTIAINDEDDPIKEIIENRKSYEKKNQAWCQKTWQLKILQLWMMQ